MVEMRWEKEMEEVMELIYRIQTDHGGKLPESEAHERLGAWLVDAVKRAERLSWLVAKGSPAMLMVTYGGRKALDSALVSRENKQRDGVLKLGILLAECSKPSILVEISRLGFATVEIKH